MAIVPPPREFEERGDVASIAGPIPAGLNELPGTTYAGFVTRTIGLAIDALLIGAVALAVTGAVLLVRSVFAVSGKHHSVAVAIGSALFVMWAIFYFTVFWTTTGQTIGSRCHADSRDPRRR